MVKPKGGRGKRIKFSAHQCEGTERSRGFAKCRNSNNVKTIHDALFNFDEKNSATPLLTPNVRNRNVLPSLS